MARAYAPGLKVAAHIRRRVRRLLPIAGEVLVSAGDSVAAQQIVAQTFMPGDIMPINLAKLLSMAPAEVPESMLKKEGERITRGETLARTKGIFGKFRHEYKSTVEGTIESVSSVTGQVLVRGEPLPVQVKAYLAGTVVEILRGEGCVVEADVTFIQGIFGIGGETFGPIRMAAKNPDERLTADAIREDMKGGIVVGGARITEEALEKARAVGASAVISGGIDDEDLKRFLGYDLGVAITGAERMGLTVIITEGFGEIAMAERTFKLLAAREGRDAAVNGATQIRAGVMRPEIIIPATGQPIRSEIASESSAGYLEIGMPVRVIRDPYFGRIGTVSALPSEPTVLESGSRARVLVVKFGSGESAIIPRANVELIEG